MRPGEVYWVDYPSGSGSAQSGRQPSLIIQDDSVGSRGGNPLVLTIPLTSQASTLRFPAVVRVPVTSQNGLSSLSYALVFQLRATPRTWIGARLGELDPAVLNEIHRELDRLLGRPPATALPPPATP